MKYYLKTKHLEGTQTKQIFGMPYGKTNATIDLISIGIVADDGREYYAISKDFNLTEAWNRWKFNESWLDGKEYWIRENILKPIWEELCFEDLKVSSQIVLNTTDMDLKKVFVEFSYDFNYKCFKKLLNKYGKTNEQIADDIKTFIGTKETIGNWDEIKSSMNTQFFDYYSDYDWVAFCWIFGKMINLPEGFPKYCIGLKQQMDEKEKWWRNIRVNKTEIENGTLPALTEFENYPKKPDNHNALDHAKWNKKIHEFINSL